MLYEEETRISYNNGTLCTNSEMKNVVFWDVALCRSCVNRRFRGRYRLHLQGRNIRERGTSMSRWLQTVPPVEDTQL
jgi:hypothetical protein